MPKKKDILVLIDAPNLAFRMFFALERTGMRSGDGTPTWAVFGFFKALFDLLDKTKANSIAAAYDCKEPTFRHEAFDDYKANRPDEMPDELQEQWPLIREGLHAFNIPIYEKPGYEADDVIGTLAKKAANEGKKVYILTGDRDAFQLINENVSVLVPSKGELKEYKKQEVFDYWGIWPEQVIDFKGLCGDPSDNIPGIRGVGEKTAAKLLTEFGTMEEVLKNADNVAGKALKEKIRTGGKDAKLSKELATILTSVPIKIDLKDTHLNINDLDESIKYLQRFEFNSFIKRLPLVLAPFNDGKPVDIKEPEKLVVERPEQITLNIGGNGGVSKEEEKNNAPDLEVTIIDNEKDFKALLSKLKKKKFICVDLETTSVDSNTCDIVGFAFSWFEEEDKSLEFSEYIDACYIPVGHNVGDQLGIKNVCKELKPILEKEDKLIIAQNCKFEYKILKRHGIELKENIYDTMLASYVEDPTQKHGLKTQALEKLDVQMTKIEELIGTGKKQLSMSEVEIEKVAPYAIADVHYTMQLANYYKSELHKKLSKVLAEIDTPLVPVLGDMELDGVRIDTKVLKKLSDEISKRVRELEESIFKLSEEVFNINSSQQLGKVLFDKLGFSHEGRITKSGQYSTDANTLDQLAKEDKTGIIENILEYRQLTKLISTYTDSLPVQINPETKNIHCDFNQTVTTTGRLSSSNPNLQNIPIRSELGRKIRKAFVSRFDGGVILSADYSQIELRLLAHLSNDPVLVEAFKNGEDIHQRTAMEIYGIPSEKVTSEMRSVGKTLNFALIYRQGPVATARQLNISQKEAKDFIEKYFNSFKKVEPYFDKILEGVEENDYVETFYGRRRHFRDYGNVRPIIQREYERAACNAPLQGTAADLMKLAMIELHKKLHKFKSKLIIQVHDELLIDTHPDEEEKIEKLVVKSMEMDQPFKVPLVVNIAKGKNWYDCK